MGFLNKFKLVFLDLDGLLVDSEPLHFFAYQLMCEEYNCKLNWSLEEYNLCAHLGEGGIKQAIYKKFPEIYAKEPRWHVLYARKKEIYENLIEKQGVSLLPGAHELLMQLSISKTNRCVVTNSTQQQVTQIKKHLPILDTIANWVTREGYDNAKPAPDAYLKALNLFNEKSECAVGLEDTQKGVMALKGAGIVPVLVCPLDHPQLMDRELSDLKHFKSLEALNLYI